MGVPMPPNPYTGQYGTYGPPTVSTASTIDQSQRAGERGSEGAYDIGGINPTTGNALPNYGPSKIAGQRQDANGTWWNVDQYGSPVSRYTPPVTGGGLPGLGGLGGGGATWYEQQQIALDKQRIADAEKAQAAQEAYQLEQQKIAQSNAVESANQAFRDAQLKSTYGTINGMAYGSPKGSPFVQQLPEPLLLKEAYAANGQPDPWAQGPAYGGYTGSSFMNMQQPGLANQGDPNMQVPLTGAGSAIHPALAGVPGDQLMQWHDLAHQLPHPTGPPVTGAIPSMDKGGRVPGYVGQPQLIIAHGGEEIIPAAGKPMPTAVAGEVSGYAQATLPGYYLGGRVPDAPAIPAPTSAPAQPWYAPIASYQPKPVAPTSQPLAPAIAPVAPPKTTPWYTPIASYRPPVTSPVTTYSVPQAIAPKVSTPPPPLMPSPVSPAPNPQALFNIWHDAMHSSGATDSPKGSPLGTPAVGYSSGPVNAYGQAVNSHVVHPPIGTDIVPGPGVLNHMPYSPAMTGLSQYGALMTPNGTPVVMSNWQRANLMPSSITGPGGYEDYAQQVAGWNPTDLAALGRNETGNFGTDLSAPKNYTPIAVQPAPAGG